MKPKKSYTKCHFKILKSTELLFTKQNEPNRKFMKQYALLREIYYSTFITRTIMLVTFGSTIVTKANSCCVPILHIKCVQAHFE
jgi:hypothetical protein